MNDERTFGSEDTVGSNLLPFDQLAIRVYYAQLELDGCVLSMLRNEYTLQKEAWLISRGERIVRQ